MTQKFSLYEPGETVHYRDIRMVVEEVVFVRNATNPVYLCKYMHNGEMIYCRFHGDELDEGDVPKLAPAGTVVLGG